MADSTKPISVGAPDPELKNSPIMEETDEDFEVLAQEVGETPVCYFNNVSYPDGRFVCSGSGELLKCTRGVWLLEGTCDPENL
ncbi:MAG: hypothetical protein P8009_08125 [Gammaproteobacteria bacterium]|nr:hypothetical protein [Gammaproteobacteria bacterium]